MVLFSPPTINPPLPPYVRLGTVIVGSRGAKETCVIGNIAYIDDSEQCIAFDLSHMKRLWTSKLPGGYMQHLFATRNRVYVSAHGRDRNAILIALNSKD